MCNIESFKIDLKALPQGVSTLEFKLDDAYFKAIDAPDVQSGELLSSLSISRTDDFFELNFHTEGIVHIPCDICLDDMEQSIETDDRLVVRFGEDYSEETRTLKRRTHDKAVAPTLAVCPNCGAYYVYHTVCPTCGYYRGKVAIVKEAAE